MQILDRIMNDRLGHLFNVLEKQFAFLSHRQYWEYQFTIAEF